MKPYGKKEILDFLVDQYNEMTENGLDLQVLEAADDI